MSQILLVRLLHFSSQILAHDNSLTTLNLIMSLNNVRCMINFCTSTMVFGPKERKGSLVLNI
ncbi:CLUMA_CG018832, isoform A [Clunio marinus]|uniref:CLUMA_CG018832, isoform A n=1 Tax=Clunio marinus TaxID=568069 RepID=A0A1J1J211_9DIPT|nr:CLUMA_CG018832, isoform A [Clunio marinus]